MNIRLPLHRNRWVYRALNVHITVSALGICGTSAIALAAEGTTLAIVQGSIV
jgi:hypothetical protein